MSFILNILEASDARRGELEALPWTRSMVEGRAGRASYVAFLSDLYHVVKHFCPLMAAAASRCGEDSNAVRTHLYEAMHDEQGHEQMVIDDLSAFGKSPSEVTGSEPGPAMLALIGCNYYLVERDHPAMVLGMLYTQEFIASCYAGMVAANTAHSLDMNLERGFSFLQSHASLDQEHVVRLHNLMAKIEDPLVQDKIVNAINLNFYLLKAWGEELGQTAHA